MNNCQAPATFCAKIKRLEKVMKPLQGKMMPCSRAKYWGPLTPRTIISGGSRTPIDLTVSGQFTFPVTTILRPKSCPEGTSCNTVRTTVSAFTEINNLISADVLWCSGVSDNWYMDYEIIFQDTAGNGSNAAEVTVLCREPDRCWQQTLVFR